MLLWYGTGEKYPILTSTNWTQVSGKSLQKMFLAQTLQNGKPMCGNSQNVANHHKSQQARPKHCNNLMSIKQFSKKWKVCPQLSNLICAYRLTDVKQIRFKSCSREGGFKWVKIGPVFHFGMKNSFEPEEQKWKNNYFFKLFHDLPLVGMVSLTPNCQ